MQNPRRLERKISVLWLAMLLGQIVSITAHPAHASALRNNDSQHPIIGFANTDIPNHQAPHAPEKKPIQTVFDNTTPITPTQIQSNASPSLSPLDSLDFVAIAEGHQYLHDHTPGDIALAFSTPEEAMARDNQPWLNQINQPYAAELGTKDGRNITIGFADAALQIDHPLLFGKVRQTYNAFANSANVDESFTKTHSDGHATTVVSTALGSLALVTGEEGDKHLQGVAPGAKIAMTQVFSTPEQERLSSSSLSNGIAWLTRSTRVPIINLSISAVGKLQHATVSAMQAGIARDVLFTIAANNKTETESYSLADYASADWAKKQIIAVGAVDSQNQATHFSEPAGTLAQWYVVAPRSNITVASNGQTYENKSGASFAAPMVAGQAALIKSFWPQLKAATIAQIIFKTATHLGNSPEGTPDPIYGWGLINVRKSLQPIGQLTIQTKNGTHIPVANIALGNAKGALGGAIQQAAAHNAFVISGATDMFNRHFSVNLNATIAPERSRSLANMLGNDSDRMIRTSEIILDKQGSRLSYTRSDLSTAPGNLKVETHYLNQNTSTISAASLIKRFSNGSELAIATGGQNSYFGLADYRINGAPQFTDIGLADAYHHLVSGASSFAIGQQLSDGLKIKFGMIGTQLPDAMSSQRSVNPLIDATSTSTPNDVTLGHIEISKQIGNSMLGFGFSVLGEQNALLGTQLGTGFTLNNQASTRILTLNAAHKLVDDIAIAGYYSQGTTQDYNNNGDSLISTISATRSQAYGLGLILSNRWRTADSLAFSMSAPLATTTGTMTLDLPSTVDIDGNLLRNQTTINLASPAREYRAEIAYFTPVSKNASLGLTVIHKQNVGNLPGNSEQLAVANYRINF